MIELKNKLPFWLHGLEALKLAAAAKDFWAHWEAWLGEVAPQADIRVCSGAALALHAAADMGSDGKVHGWAVALILSGLDRVGVVAGATPTDGLEAPQQFSAVGVATRRAVARP